MPFGCLQYVDVQQVLLSSVTARSQLCKKCGSPLNLQSCSDVHVAWLSAATSERLSKRLAGSSSAAARTRGGSSSSSKDKLVNRVVAVRRCMVSFTMCSCLFSALDVKSIPQELPTHCGSLSTNQPCTPAVRRVASHVRASCIQHPVEACMQCIPDADCTCHASPHLTVMPAAVPGALCAALPVSAPGPTAAGPGGLC